MNSFKLLPLSSLLLMALLALGACDSPSPDLTPQPWSQDSAASWQRVDTDQSEGLVLNARTVGVELWTFSAHAHIVTYDSRIHYLAAKTFIWYGDWRFGPALSERFMFTRGPFHDAIGKVYRLQDLSINGEIRLDSSLSGAANVLGYQSFLPFPEAMILRPDDVGVIGSRREADGSLVLLELDLKFYTRLALAGRFDSLGYRAQPLPTDSSDRLRWLALTDSHVAYGTDQQVGGINPDGEVSVWLDAAADTLFVYQGQWYLDLSDRVLRSADQGLSWETAASTAALPTDRTFVSLAQHLLCYREDSLFQINPQTFEAHYLEDAPFTNEQITTVLDFDYWLVVTTLGGIYYLPQHALENY